MSFEPHSDKHAVVECVVGLTFQRPFFPAEMERLARAANSVAPDLPRLNRSSTFGFLVAEGSVQPDHSFSPNGIMLDRYRVDGSLEWRLNVNQGSIFVNCLDYSHWNEVWPRIRAYLERASAVLESDENLVSSAIIQYIDIFNWHGAGEDYDVYKLLNRESPLLPPAMGGRGHYWHQHQGWFREEKNTPAAGRTLERINIDGGVIEGIPNVRIDTYIQLTTEPSSVSGLFGKGNAVDSIFECLHDRNKALVSTLLNKEMQERIGLNAV